MLEIVMRMLFISCILFSIFFTLKRAKKNDEIFSRFDEDLKLVEREVENKLKEKND